MYTTYRVSLFTFSLRRLLRADVIRQPGSLTPYNLVLARSISFGLKGRFLEPSPKGWDSKNHKYSGLKGRFSLA